MSEFSEYLLVPRAAEPVALLERIGATGLVVPRGGAWTIVVAEAQARVAAAAPRVMVYSYAGDHGLVLDLLESGERVARLKASSELRCRGSFDPAPWVARGLVAVTPARALAKRLSRDDWRHETVRDDVAELLGFAPVSWLAPSDLQRENLDALRQRFPDAAFVRAGARAPLTAAPSAALEADVDLAGCVDGQSWLAARRRLAPEQASPRVMAELERVVREGRFQGEGDRAVVVREAAAMLLARALAAQRGDAAEAWLTTQEQQARSPEERAAWTTALARFRTAKR
jgi:hypothetical protein